MFVACCAFAELAFAELAYACVFLKVYVEEGKRPTQGRVEIDITVDIKTTSTSTTTTTTDTALFVLQDKLKKLEQDAQKSENEVLKKVRGWAWSDL